MSDIAIRVEGLSKQYRIGHQQARYKTIRESLIDWSKAPFQRAGRILRGQGSAADLDETIWALKDVSFEIKQGEVVGVIGRNGAGKTTLLKILSRITEPTTGEAWIHGRVGSLLEVGTGFHPELTGRENIYLNGAILGMKRDEINNKFDEIVDFAEIEKFIDTPVKHYSSGMYVRLAFSVAAFMESEILLVDEVLAVGDVGFQKKCLGKMGSIAQQGRTVIFVSHNMTAVQHLCQRGFVIDGGAINFDGIIRDAVHKYVSGMPFKLQPNLAERNGRSGRQWLRFIKVAFYDSQGNELRQVLNGQDVCIRFYYRSRREKRNASVLVAFNVRNSQGFSLANLNSVDTGQEILEVFQNGYFECWWPKFNLRSGIYDCTLFCSVNGEIVDWVQNAFAIYVEDGNYYGSGKMIDRQHGEILIDHSWTYGQDI